MSGKEEETAAPVPTAEDAEPKSGGGVDEAANGDADRERFLGLTLHTACKDYNFPAPPTPPRPGRPMDVAGHPAAAVVADDVPPTPPASLALGIAAFDVHGGNAAHPGGGLVAPTLATGVLPTEASQLGPTLTLFPPRSPSGAGNNNSTVVLPVADGTSTTTAGTTSNEVAPASTARPAQQAPKDDSFPKPPTRPRPVRPVDVASAPAAALVADEVPPASIELGVAASDVHGGNAGRPGGNPSQLAPTLGTFIRPRFPGFGNNNGVFALTVDGSNAGRTIGAVVATGVLPTEGNQLARTSPLFTPRSPSGAGNNNGIVVLAVANGTGTTTASTTSNGVASASTSTPAQRGPKRRRRLPRDIIRPNPSAGAGVGARTTLGAGAPAPNVFLARRSPAPAPFPWARPDRVADHYSLDELAARGIDAVEGEVQCKRCDVRTTLVLNVRAKFEALRVFIVGNVKEMHDRAPEVWKEPALPDCEKCGQKNSLRPVIPADKEKINWVFLLLGQTLGLCTLEQLKYFCGHTNQHRTGAKDRVLYSTYMELCNQLSPGGLFDMEFQRMKRGQQYA